VCGERETCATQRDHSDHAGRRIVGLRTRYFMLARGSNAPHYPQQCSGEGFTYHQA